MGRLAALLVPLLAPATILAGLRFGFDPVAAEATRPLVHREGGFVGSVACRSCHEEHFESWGRTFHSRMTRRAEPDAVLGAFDGREVAYGEESARPIRRDGRFFVDLPKVGGGRRTAEVALTVGSRRYQQYFEREPRGDGFAFLRLPILWHVETRRWLHLNTVFLHPDDADWTAERATWNTNCILCHNTGPQPRLCNYGSAPAAGEERFASVVGELGIACEACHGPGAGHALRYRDPLARYGDHLRGAGGADIVNPRRLSPDRSAAVCGQCHGQRVPEPLSRVETWLSTGPTFRSGDRLVDHVRPLAADTPAVGARDPGLFRARFWFEGTPRLTAYEYQGTVASPCHLKGGMTCGSCHSMHRGDPRGQLRPDLPGDAACLPCHERIARDVPGHTKHAGSSTGSSCVACHMPRIVYGILALHRSHRIEVPDARRDGESGRPHACTLCHLDRSLSWSSVEIARLWRREAPPPAARRDRAPLDLADSVASLLAGDAVARAVYAGAMGRPEAALAPEAKGFVRVQLLAALGDGYPSVRFLAWRSLLRLEAELPVGLGEPLLAYDPGAGPAPRRAAALELLRRFPQAAAGRLRPPPGGCLVGADLIPDLRAMVGLMELQERQVISIGE